MQVMSNMNRSTKIFVFDLAGKLIKESVLNKGINTVSINHVPSGTYLVRVTGENGELYHEKIIKE